MGKRKTINEFVNQARLVHGDEYDYSQVEYKNSHTKVIIKCPIHDKFEQRPHRHLNGDGCKECSKKIIGVKNSSTINEFIEKARLVHGDKYDYSQVVYKNNKTKIRILCSIHGEFEQYPTSHLTMRAGCSKCSYERLKIEKIKTLDDFINQARLVHGDKYDYSQVDYENTNNYVNIFCPKHGLYPQKPYKHLQNQGCPICKESKLEKKIRVFLINKDIKFIQGYSKKNGGDWLQNQSLDFYLPDLNSAIECQGEQHFKPVDFGNKGNEFANKAFEINLKRDKKKYDLCKSNNINMFYFTDKIEHINGGYLDIVYTNEEELFNKLINNI